MEGEVAFIEALRALATTPGARGLNDDAALLTLGREVLVVTHDTMVEGVHWLPGQDAADVAFKLVASNLSDLAAKGCKPLGVMLSYMLGDADANARFVAGLGEALAQFKTPLLGGDTVGNGESPVRSVGITALGRPVRNPPPSRADAKPGQDLHVTGTIGAALAGFEALQSGDTGEASAPYRRPLPLIEEGRKLARLAGAMMDVSDGLLLDAFRMAEASGTTIAIDAETVPVPGALSQRRGEAMRWGDDYQLLFTLDPGTVPPVPATRIGKVMARGDAPLLVDDAPLREPADLGYRHEAG